MIISVLTSSHLRHKYLVSKLSNNFKKVLYINENKPLVRAKRIPIVKNYFSKVKNAEKKTFKNKVKIRKNVSQINFKYGKINEKKLLKNKIFLKSDIFLVFGSSIIRGALLNFLLKKKALNIHMGVLPFYRGTDCNFWAIHDKKYKNVGASLILLSKKIDDGKIIKIFLGKLNKNKFLFTMQACKKAIDSTVAFLKKQKKPFKTRKIDKKKLIRLSKFTDLNYKSIKNFYKIKII